MPRPPYFSIHGCDEAGWSVMLYQWVPNRAAPDGNSEDPDKLTTRQGWARPKLLNSFEEVKALIEDHKAK